MTSVTTKSLGLLLWTALVALALTPSVHTANAATSCPGYATCPQVNFQQIFASDPDAVDDQAGVAAHEQAALTSLQQPNLTLAQSKALLGAALAFDVNLSVNRNEACFSCHLASAGFTGGVSALDSTTASFPGSVNIRTGNRKPMSAAYAVFAPVLYYDAGNQDSRPHRERDRPVAKRENSETNFFGGNFWDSRATGLVTGSPTADQAMGPPTNPLEMALPDQACAIRRISQGQYAGAFQSVWGPLSLSIAWPANTDAICAQPNEGAANQQPVALSTGDRATANAAYIDMALSIAAFEATSYVSAFSSKYDAYLAGKAKLTTNELNGLRLFNGKGDCNQCHLSLGAKPLFTDFSSQNIGIPKNSNNPYFNESVNDGAGLIANPAGANYVDNGLGPILAASGNPQWAALAPAYMGSFQVATVRNAAAIPREGFVRAYMHNGYFTDLKTLVHFYNTRDVLPKCKRASQIVGVNCWPAPTNTTALNTFQTGDLHLTGAEETAIVDFLGTLTDGYFVPAE